MQAARELGVRIVASRGSMDLGASDGGLPPDELVEDLDSVLADTERLVGELHETGTGARVQIAVAPCSPFSVTRRLMKESAALARRLGLPLHTHLAETVEEHAYCLELYGCTPVEYLTDLGWLGEDVWCAHCVHLAPEDVSDFAGQPDRGRALPDLEPPARRRGGARARNAGRGRSRGARRRRVGVERAERPPLRGEAGAARGAGPRRARGDDRPRGASARYARRRRAARARTTSARWSRASAPTSRSGGRTSSSSAARADPVAGLVLSAPHRVDRLVVGGEDVVRGGALVRADEADIAREHRAQARRFAA